MQVWNVLHAAHWKCKKSPFLHYRTTLLGCIFTTKACIDNPKKKLVKQQYLLPTSSQYGRLRPTNGWDRFTSFNRFRILASLLHYSPEANQTLHDLWPSYGLVHYIYIFWVFCHLTEFYYVQNSLCVQVLRSSILEALLHGTPAAGLSQNLRHGTRNGITELSQRAPPIFGWAAITLGIGPHSSYRYSQ